MADRQVKVLSLVLLTVHGTTLPLLVRYSRVRKEDSKMFIASTSVVLMELIKLSVCLSVLFNKEKRNIRTLAYSVYETVILQPIETAKVCVPSVIYIAQNNLYYIALSNLEASTYAVTYQLRILTTALFYVSLLRKPLSAIQWASLVLLMIGISAAQLEQEDSGAKQKNLESQSKFVGLMAVLAMCLTSGFAGVYFEKVLKGSHVTIWMQNVRLALLGIPISIFMMIAKDGAAVYEGGFLQGYSPVVWLVTALNACGGLIIALVIKYADNILKAYSQAMAILFACVGSALLFDFRPGRLFVGGTVLVALSIYLYNANPPQQQMNVQLVANGKEPLKNKRSDDEHSDEI